MGEISLSMRSSGFRVGDGVISGVVAPFCIVGIGGAGLWACTQSVSYRLDCWRMTNSDLVVSRLPEKHRRWEGEFNKYLQDVEARAALAAGMER